ncbi:MAG TPA: hypothetical protein VMG12_40720 [Polyangiaceae bacterium]|nr:hypothetical protein [Polyangiaceae bacterium]
MHHDRLGPQQPPAQRWAASGFACLLGLGVVWSCQTTDVELLERRQVLAEPEPVPEPEPEPEPIPEAPLLDPDALPVPPVSALGCPSVDFLFVVDNSRSMREEQDSLVRSFPGFIDVVQNQLRTRDHHVMVVDTDASGGAAGLSGLVGLLGGDIDCRPAPACCRLACSIGGLPFVTTLDSCNGDACDVVRAAPAPDRCEGALGAGKRLDPDGGDCGVLGSDRYLTEAQTALPDAFSCVARVGTFGDGDEQPMGALLEAIGPEQNGSDGCNTGFLRDDAVLVVTIISDEDDENSPGDIGVWREALLRAKHDNPAAIVVLGLVGDDAATPLPGGPCGDEAQAAPTLQSFVQGFRYGSLGSVCAPDYAPFFERAVSVIDDACEEFQSIR